VDTDGKSYQQVELAFQKKPKAVFRKG